MRTKASCNPNICREFDGVKRDMRAGRGEIISIKYDRDVQGRVRSVAVVCTLKDMMNRIINEDYARKTYHAIKKPDDLRPGLADAERDNVPANSII